MTKGLYSAVQTYSSIAQDLLAGRGLANGDLTVVQSRFQNPQWSDFAALSAAIKEIFQALISLRASLEQQQAASSQTTTTVTAFFIVMVVLANVAYYPVIISRLNRSIKGNRALLLLLPEDVIHSVRVLRETMAALAKRLL